MVTENLRQPPAVDPDDPDGTAGEAAGDAGEVFVFPASFAQERLWFLQRYAGSEALFNIPSAFRLRGSLDAAALDAALTSVVRRHESLRTGFGREAGRLEQLVDPQAPASLLERVDLSQLPEADRERAARRQLAEAAIAGFDLEAGPLLRARLLKLGDEHHLLALTVHHIVADGWSLGVLYRETSELYAAAKAARAAALPELPIQYGDYALWQRETLDADTLARRIESWRRRLEDAPRRLELPLDRPRPAVQSHRGAVAERTLPGRLARPLERLAGDAGASRYMVLLAAFAALLHHHTGRRDLVLGTAVANRGRPELEGLIGFFANTLPLRLGPIGDEPFRRLLERVREAALDVLGEQDLPFDRLVEALAPERDPSHNPLLQVMFLFEEGEGAELRLPGVDCEPLPVATGTAKYDLALTATLRDGRLSLRADYAADLFDPTTVGRLLAGYETLLATALEDPSRGVADLPVLSAAACHQVALEWNDTATPELLADACLHHGFERRAHEAPEAPAVISGGGAVTYGELDRRANRLARHLRAAGVGPGVLVGVHLHRSARMVEAVLAIHKAGGAYVPLDAEWPAERIRWIVESDEVTHLVAEAATLGRIEAVAGGLAGDLSLATVLLGPDEHGAKKPGGATAAGDGRLTTSRPDPDAPAGPLPAAAGADDLAYVIFTSGSTGRPKGVVVRHRAAVNLVRWVNRRFAVGPGDRLLFVTSLSFDLSVYDVFGTLAAGGTIRLADEAEGADPQRLLGILTGEPVTFWDSAPAALQQLVPYMEPPADGRTPALRLVFLSGDWVPVSLPDTVRDAFPGARVVSLGGATEATVWSNYFPVGRVDPEWSSIPYGRPIANARYHVLDGRLRPAPLGVPGDLYIAGECLSTGYARAPELTAAQYLPDPFAGHAGAVPGGASGGRLYHTGDRARYRADGELEFLGRIDHQVKVRGYRIELGEIEAVLGDHPGVAEAVVLAREDTPGNQRLVAYLRPRDPERPPAADELIALAAERLPPYMLPADWVTVERWPQTVTGKLDREALPSPGGGRSRSPAADAPPQPSARQRIAALWAEVLGVDDVDPEVSFFDQGGNSLLLAEIHVELQEMFDREIPMVTLFRHPTVAELAAELGGDEAAAAAEPSKAADTETAAEPAAYPASGGGGAIAVVGMAGRFPGAAGVDELWRLLRDGREGVRRFSDEELLAAGTDAAELADPKFVRARGALDDPELFDAGFFGLTPREAQLLDPQHRLLLECAWQALESAGHPPRPDGPRIGVFAGASDNGYGRALAADRDLVAAVGGFQIGLANRSDYLPTRVSYELDLKGPSLDVQTACSTSLVAVHLARRALLAGECDLALAGGVSVSLEEVSGYLYLDGGIDSPDGRTRAFDADARGVVGGSGVGVVVLRRLDRALADGDTIHAVIRGSAINNDGAGKVGFTAPSVDGQAAVIRAALADAGVEPASIGYVEAHGTATPMGDPIEIAALAQAFGDGLPPASCAVGSVKTNLGHLDAAAGVAGLIKAVLAVRQGEIPPSLHFRRPNPEIDFASTPFRVADELTGWPRGDGPRRAGVSSFGIGGTNAHLVLEQAPVDGGEAETGAAEPDPPAHLLVLSAKCPAALERAGAALARHLDSGGDDAADGAVPALADVAYTLAAGRRAFVHRRAVVCRDRRRAAAALRGAAGGGLAGEAPAGPPPVAFLFPGQGAQYPGMAAELYTVERRFREVVDEACERLTPELGFDLRRVLFPLSGEQQEAAARLRDTAVTQPALFVVEYALARLWMDWGVTPKAMLGHSLGEYTAACLAGVFPLDGALRLVAARGRLMAEQPPGDMLAVAASEDELSELLEDEPELALATINAPAACVASGPREAIARLAARLAEGDVETRQLHTSHAFHSPMMEPAVGPFCERVAEIGPRAPSIPFVSNSTGTWIRDDQATDPAYWGRHLRSPVRFADGVGTLLADRDASVLLEIGPGHTLTRLTRQHPERERAVAAVPTLPGPRDANGDDLDVTLTAAGRLWVAGVGLDLPALWHGQRRRRVPLPTYPFDRRRYWLDGAAPLPAAGGDHAAGGDRTSGSEAAAPRGETEEAVAAAFAETLGIEAVGRDDDFFDLGGSSLMGVSLGNLLRRRLGAELPSGFLLEASTVAAVAARAGASANAGDAAPAAPACLVRLAAGPGGDRTPLCLVHPVGGHVFTFRELGRQIGGERPLLALRSRGLEPGEEPCSTIAEMAEHYLGLVRAERPRGPYLLGGASMGGMVAFEMARQLADAGDRAELLVLMDSPCGDQMPPRQANADPVWLVVRDRTGLELDAETLGTGPVDERFARAREAVQEADRGDAFDAGEALRLARVIEANVEALYAYEPQPLDVRILFFRAAERRADDPPRPELPWIELGRLGTETVIVPGDHESMHRSPHLSTLAHHLRRRLADLR